MIKAKHIQIFCKIVFIGTLILSILIAILLIILGIDQLVDDAESGKIYILLIIAGALFPIITTFITGINLYPLYALANIDYNIGEVNNKLNKLMPQTDNCSCIEIDNTQSNLENSNDKIEIVSGFEDDDTVSKIETSDDKNNFEPKTETLIICNNNELLEINEVRDKIQFLLQKCDELNFNELKQIILNIDCDDHMFNIFKKRIEKNLTKEEILNSIEVYLSF